MTKRHIYIYLDDIRTPPMNVIPKSEEVVLCRSYKSAVATVQNLDKVSVTLTLDLDHDLGTKKSGYDFCKWLLEQGWIGRFHCHTANPVGAENMRQLLLSHHGWIEF